MQDKNNLTKSYSKGIAAIVISAFGFATMAFFVKQAGDVPVLQKAVFRNLITMIVSFLLLLRSREKFYLAPKNRWTMFWRCTFGTIGFVANFWAIQNLYLGDASILQKMSPFFAILMSVIWLHEKPNKIAVLSIFVALLGAVFVVKPSAGLVSLPAMVGLFGGFCAGSAYTLVRKLGVGGVPGPLIIFSFSLFSVLAISPAVVCHYQPMTWPQTANLLLAGFCAVIGQVFVTKAYTYAPAKEISVFDYSQVIFAALLGFIFLQEIPDTYSLIGYVIIILTAVLKCYWEGKIAQSPKEDA